MKEADAEVFEWEDIGERISSKLEVDAEVKKEMARHDRDVEVIQYCLSNRSKLNDELLMQTIGIRDMLDFYQERQEAIK